MRKKYAAAISVVICLMLALVGCQASTEMPNAKDGVKSQNADQPQSLTNPSLDSQETGGLVVHMPQAAVVAPEYYQTSWTSRTGGTEIIIDAPVEVAEVSSYPIVTVKIQEVTEEQVNALAKVVFDSEGYSGDMVFSEPFGEEYFKLSTLNLESNRRANGHIDSYLSAYNQYYYGALSGSNIRFSVLGNSEDNWYSFTAIHSGILHGESIPTSKYDYTSALALARQVQQSIAPELSIVSVGTVHGEKPSRSDDAQMADTDAYRFDFTRQIGGVPVTYEYRQVGSTDDEFSPPCAYESLTVLISDRGIYAVEYNNPYEVVCVDQENVQLLSFEQIMEIARSISPLQYVSYETEGRISEIHIDRITLGYMRVQKRDNPNEFHMIPVWDFFGYVSSQTEDGREVGQKTYYLSQLTLNATDGTVIDRNYGY